MKDKNKQDDPFFEYWEKEEEDYTDQDRLFYYVDGLDFDDLPKWKAELFDIFAEAIKKEMEKEQLKS